MSERTSFAVSSPPGRQQADHLTPGVDTGVGAPGHPQRRRPPEHGEKGLLETPLDRGDGRLLGPAVQVGTVVLQLHAVCVLFVHPRARHLPKESAGSDMSLPAPYDLRYTAAPAQSSDRREPPLRPL